MKEQTNKVEKTVRYILFGIIKFAISTAFCIGVYHIVEAIIDNPIAPPFLAGASFVIAHSLFKIKEKKKKDS